MARNSRAQQLEAWRKRRKHARLPPPAAQSAESHGEPHRPSGATRNQREEQSLAPRREMYWSAARRDRSGWRRGELDVPVHGAAPWFHCGKQQADRQQRLPVHQPDPRCAQLEGPDRGSSRRDQARCLCTPGSQVAEPICRVHVRSPISRRISSTSSAVRWRSSIRCTSRGSAEPLNTRLTKSRTMTRITLFFGWAGR